MGKDHTGGIRKKNLGFRPAGKDSLHDAAYNIIAQLGRGTTDFIATAVVYYAQKQAAGDVDPAFRELLVRRQSHPKLLFIPEITNTDGGTAPKPTPKKPRMPPVVEPTNNNAKNAPDAPPTLTQPYAASDSPDIVPMSEQNGIVADSTITPTEMDTKEMTTMTTEQNIDNTQPNSNSMPGFLKRLAGGFKQQEI